ncbi:hypothetical protein NECAME_09028 [Necator americanus]|uniref:ARC105/Med15 mediator subunit C-terminal domain-containing protein n=1 Tax=Necator americanus TaxID=51031 RepID=W2TFQ2_NECAM|nr:hypothetical protein NECAME_09028 [Necator americanus]ETN80668.1 hypothetical protein NECAME_09028 [Necator americanus]
MPTQHNQQPQQGQQPPVSGQSTVLEALINQPQYPSTPHQAATTHNPHAAAMQNGHMGMAGQGMVDGINAVLNASSDHHPNPMYGTQSGYGPPSIHQGNYPPMHPQQMWPPPPHLQQQGMMIGPPMSQSQGGGPMQSYRESPVEHHRPYPAMRPQMRPPPVVQSMQPQAVDSLRMGSGSAMEPLLNPPPSSTSIPPRYGLVTLPPCSGQTTSITTTPVMAGSGGGGNGSTGSAGSAEQPGVDDLYNMDDFLPTPMEAVGNVQGNGTKLSLPDAARRELSQLSDRFEFDNNPESHHDPHCALVKCKIKGQQVPALRLVIPLSYPAASVTVDRAAIDLDAFFYDDLQNVVHERLARPGLHSITEFLNTWETTVRQYTSNQNNTNTTISPFDELFQNYDNIIT